MDYEKKYKEALERARKWYNDSHITIGLKGNLKDIFPELKENEDEKIRMSLIELFKDMEWDDSILHDYNMDKDKTIAWLEKQVPAYLSHDDEILIKQLTEYFTTGKGLQNTNDTIVEWLADVKRKLEKQGDYKRLVEEIKDRKELLSKEKEKATSVNDKLSLGGRIAILEELLAFTKEKQGEQNKQVYFPKFTLDDVLALQCCMETVKKVQEDKELYEKLNLLHGKVYDAYQLEKQGENPQGKTALEAIKEEKVDNQNCIKPANKEKPKFKKD